MGRAAEATTPVEPGTVSSSVILTIRFEFLEADSGSQLPPAPSAEFPSTTSRT